MRWQMKAFMSQFYTILMFLVLMLFVNWFGTKETFMQYIIGAAIISLHFAYALWILWVKKSKDF